MEEPAVEPDPQAGRRRGQAHQAGGLEAEARGEPEPCPLPSRGPALRRQAHGRVCPEPRTRYLNEVSCSTPTGPRACMRPVAMPRSEEHTSELQLRQYLVCRLLLEKKKKTSRTTLEIHTQAHT